MSKTVNRSSWPVNGPNLRAGRLAEIGGGISLIAFPAMFMAVFLLHVESPAEMFRFAIRHEPYLASDIMAMLADPHRSRRYYVIPHLLGYLSMPVLVAAAVTLGNLLFARRPWFALLGATITVVGAVFMGGMLAIWASFAPVGAVPAGDLAGAEAALAGLIQMRGVLLYSTLLAGCATLGLMVLAVGLWLGGIVRIESAAAILVGSVIMSVFIDVDNLMFIGALLILSGIAPTGWRLIRGPAGGGAGLPGARRR